MRQLPDLDHIFCPDRETPLFHPRKRQQMFHQPVDRRDHNAAGTLQDPPHDLNPLFRQQVSVDIRRIKQQIPRRVQRNIRIKAPVILTDLPRPRIIVGDNQLPGRQIRKLGQQMHLLRIQASRDKKRSLSAL